MMSSGQKVAAIAFGWTAFCAGLSSLSSSLNFREQFTNTPELSPAEISKFDRNKTSLKYVDIKGPFSSLGTEQQNIVQTFVSPSGFVALDAKRACFLHSSSDKDGSCLVASETPLPEGTQKVKGTVCETALHFNSTEKFNFSTHNNFFIQAEFALVGDNWLSLKKSLNETP